jgi:hypothetical protein
MNVLLIAAPYGAGTVFEGDGSHEQDEQRHCAPHPQQGLGRRRLPVGEKIQRTAGNGSLMTGCATMARSITLAASSRINRAMHKREGELLIDTLFHENASHVSCSRGAGNLRHDEDAPTDP